MSRPTDRRAIRNIFLYAWGIPALIAFVLSLRLGVGTATLAALAMFIPAFVIAVVYVYVFRIWWPVVKWTGEWGDPLLRRAKAEAEAWAKGGDKPV